MNKKEYLDWLYYDVGKQATHLELTYTFIKDNEKIFTKWNPYLSADETIINKTNQRTILKNEIILDKDKGDYQALINKLKEDGWKFYAFQTKSGRARHIHLFFNGLTELEDNERKGIKEFFIKKYECDTALKIEKHMIALEYTSHWKTEEPKELIEKVEGINDISSIKEEYTQFKKESELKENNSDFILDDSDIPQRIDHAVGFIEINKQKIRYYGIKIHQNISKDIKGIPTIHKELVNAIVLENGLIVSKYSKPCSFEFSSEIGLKENRWSLKSIKIFCNNEYKTITFKRVYDEFKRFYDDSMVFEFEEWYILNPIWDMCTYYYDLIDKFLIIKHEGDSGSAKSKGMKVSSNLSFNGRKFLCPTPANFFRYRHNNKATLCIEEAERLFDDELKKNSEQSELVEYLNGSYEKGNYVPRQNDKNINQTDEFDPAGFTRIGSIKSLKGALEKRSIPLNMIKANTKDQRGNIEIPSSNDLQYQKARDSSYINGLKNYEQYQEALNNVKNEYSLSNRQWTLAKPLIAMAHCIDNKIEKKLGLFIAKLFTIRDDVSDDSSWEMILANCLIELSCKHEEQFFISTNDIKNKFSEKVNQGEKTHRVTSNKITKLMNELRLRDFSCRNTSGSSRGFELSFFKISEILIRNERINFEELIKKVSEVSDCQIKEDKIKKWYSDNFTDNFKNKQSVKQSSDNLTDLTLFLTPPKEFIKPFWDEKAIVWHKCKICDDSPCNEAPNSFYLCKKHFNEVDLNE